MNVASIMTGKPTVIAEDASLDFAMSTMEEEGLRHLPVVRDGKLVGVLSERDLLAITGWRHAEDKPAVETPAGQVGTHMQSPVATVAPTDSVSKAALRLATRHVGCLPVVEDGVLVGIVTETDFVTAFLDARRNGRISAESDAPVSGYMTPDVVTVDESTDAEEAMDVMRTMHIRHLPVMEDGQLAGILSERDFLRAIGRATIDEAAVREYMTRGAVTVRADEPVSAAAELLSDGKISALPVVGAGGEVVGILTLPDLLAPCLEALAGQPDASS